MRRAAFVAVVLVSVFVPTMSSQAAGNASVTLVHGLGPAPSAVDVYVDNALVAANFQYSNQATLPAVAEGTHNVQICNQTALPPNPLVGACPAGAVNGNSGTDITVVGGRSYTAVAAYSPIGVIEGRPTVVLIEDDLTCNSATAARMDLYSAAAFLDPPANEVDFLYEAQTIAGPVTPGGKGGSQGIPKTAAVDVQRRSNHTSVVGQLAVQTTAQTLTIKILVGNPQQDADYALLTRQIPLTGCPVVTTTSTTSTTVRVVTVTPTFTG